MIVADKCKYKACLFFEEILRKILVLLLLALVEL
jgi:hypothetical protein